MDSNEFDKLNKNFKVGEETLLYGITPRLGSHIAKRFKGLRVLETCGGAGFITIELAKVASKVFSVDINAEYQSQSKHNVMVAGVEGNIQYFLGDILSENILKQIPEFDAAILDPVWNDQVLSHMSPPADLLFETIYKKTHDIAFILPPNTSQEILNQFPAHELELLYLDEELALLCLYFGKLAKQNKSEFKG